MLFVTTGKKNLKPANSGPLAYYYYLLLFFKPAFIQDSSFCSYSVLALLNGIQRQDFT